MRNALLVVLALVLAAPAGAQEPALELRQALELARLHSPLLPVASGRLRAAAGAARERSASPNPVLELRQENVGGALPTDRYALVTLPLDLTLQRSALRASGRERIAAAHADSATTAREVEVTVATLYWRSALSDALSEAAAVEAAALEEIVGFEETRLGEGVVAEGVVLRARMEVERARLALARARGEAQQAHAALAQAVGVPSDELPHAAAPVASAAPILPALESAKQQSLDRRPEMEAARRRVAAAEWEVSAAWRATVPDVGLQIGAMESAGRTAAVLALSVELPIRNQGAAARERARGDLALAEAELQAMRRSVEAEVEGALAAYRRLAAAFPAESSALAAQGAEVAGIAGTAYREGAISLVELLDAQRAHANARATAATWAAELALARIELVRSLGAPIEEAL